MHPAISREFHFGSLLRFALPTVIMMIFMSMYTIVDGIFVSRFVGTDALSATNIVYPALNLVLAVAIMLSTGGSAIVARKLGEGDPQGARGELRPHRRGGRGGGRRHRRSGPRVPRTALHDARRERPPDGRLQGLPGHADALRARLGASDSLPELLRHGGAARPRARADDRGGGLQRGARLFAHRARRDGHHGRGGGHRHRLVHPRSGGGRLFSLFPKPAALRPPEARLADARGELLQRLLRDGDQHFHRRDHLPLQHPHAPLPRGGRGGRDHHRALRAVFADRALPRLFDGGRAGRQLQLRKREHPPAQAALQDLRPVHRRLVGGRLRGFAAAGGAPCGGLFPARHGGL